MDHISLLGNQILYLNLDDQNTAAIFCLVFLFEFANFYPFYQLELTYSSVILAHTRPNTYQYPGRTVLNNAYPRQE